jgi:hypothetical protein
MGLMPGICNQFNVSLLKYLNIHCLGVGASVPVSRKTISLLFSASYGDEAW